MDKVLEITSNDHIIMIDKLCKRILGHPEILGRIIKGFIKEAKDVSLEEIIEIIKGNDGFQQLNNVIDIPYHRKAEFDYFCYINLPQKEGTSKRIYLDVEIQNVENPGYALLTRGNDYLSRMITSQNGKEYDYRNYDGMKKAYVIWILPQAARKRDGHVNRYKTTEENISGATIERLESYDKNEQIMIYLNKDHKLEDKYESSDWIKTPLVIFLNNTYDLLVKKDVMKKYKFKEIEKEVEKMCNLGEMIARENIEKGHSMGLEQGLEQGQKLERITSIKNLMKKMAIPLDKAMDLLDLSSVEKEEMKKYFHS